jgi:amidase
MKTTFKLIPILILFVSCNQYGNSDRQAHITFGPAEAEMRYLGQTPPGTTAELFAPGIVSTDAVELNSVFSPDGREFFFTRLIDGPDETGEYPGTSRSIMHHMVYENGAWSEARPLRLFPDAPDAWAADMAVSPDGQLLYFMGAHPVDADLARNDMNLWVSRRVDDAWSIAEPLPAPVNTEANEVYSSVVADGSLYFDSNRVPLSEGRSTLYRAQRLDDGGFAEPVNIRFPVNGSLRVWDTFVAPDESYMVLTLYDGLYVSFRQADGSWGEPIDLGPEINAEGSEYCPMVTPDGKYLFFSRRHSDPPEGGWPNVVEGNVYWVDMEVVHRLNPGARDDQSLVAHESAFAEARDFDIIETTIAEVHRNVMEGNLTFQELVQMYLDRIDAYDERTGLNAYVVVNPNALQRAIELDEEFARTGQLRPLHGIPIVVKDNYDTHDLQTAAGSLSLKGSLPPVDAFQVRKIREAGAIILGKSNMAEFAFSPYITRSSIHGTTRNPYDLARVPAGSSGGTAAAVAANLALVGLGTDTGNSIRGPSSHTALVGIRSTMGLTSRGGIVPLYLRNDIGGPMTRTVEDAVRVLEVIAGHDPKDPVTEASKGKVEDSYLKFLDSDGLQGARIGLFRYYHEQETTDPEVKRLTERAFEELSRLGAVTVEMDIPGYEEMTHGKDGQEEWRLWCDTFHYDLNNYLETLGPDRSFRNLEEIVASGLYLAYIHEELKYALAHDLEPEKRDCVNVRDAPKNVEFRNAVMAAMDRAQVDAFVYPTWSNQPRKIGDMDSPAGNNSQHLSPHTGMPAITVPTGFTRDHAMPTGMTFITREFEEGRLIRYAYAYEQGTRHRSPPALFGPLK